MGQLARCNQTKSVWLVNDSMAGNDLQYLRQLPSIEYLHVTSQLVRDEDLVHLQGLPKLRYVDVESMHITDAGIDILARIPRLSGITCPDGNITEEGMDVFLNARPDRQINGRRSEVGQAVPDDDEGM